MSRSIDGVVTKTARPVPFGRAFTRRGPTFEPVVSKDQSSSSTVFQRKTHQPPAGSGSTKGRGTLPKGTGRAESATKPKTPLRERLQLPLIILGGMLAGFAIQNAVAGQILITIYGVMAFIYRIPSRISFILALLALLAMTGLLLLKGDLVLSQTFAVYSFLLLVVGVFTLNRELKKEGGRIYSRRHINNR